MRLIWRYGREALFIAAIVLLGMNLIRFRWAATLAEREPVVAYVCGFLDGAMTEMRKGMSTVEECRAIRARAVDAGFTPAGTAL